MRTSSNASDLDIFFKIPATAFPVNAAASSTPDNLRYLQLDAWCKHVWCLRNGWRNSCVEVAREAPPSFRLSLPGAPVWMFPRVNH